MTAADQLPQVTLKPRRALPFFHRHPWVFAGAVARVDAAAAPGDEVAVRSETGQFVARGLFNPHSNIRVRLYSWQEDVPLDRGFWSARLDEAIALRRRLFPHADQQTAFRLVFSEADGLSGLIVDRYGDWLTVQFTSRALADRRAAFVELLQEQLAPAGLWLRTEKGIRESEGLELSDGLLAGTEPPRPLVIDEDGVRSGVDIVEGQKTGAYLDQRENRAAAARYVRGRRVLDVFCYAGAFGLAAVKQGGADHVTGVDVSEAALARAAANAELNDIAPQFRFERSDAFTAMERLHAAGERFDVVILDPPKMTRHRAGLKKALRGYHSLNRLAMDLLPPGGILVSCSCSGLVDREVFEQMLAETAVRAGRRLQVLEARGQSPDHPVSLDCPENAYLKCYICRIV
ncbi:MAG: class I SAM-dependent rRNA methyltransferase [Planctomycetaceae bacterium]